MVSERSETAIISRAFVDPVSDRECTLHVAPAEDFWLAAKVSHPDCKGLADVSADLDCFYCQVCKWNGRVSGAWVVDLWDGAQNDGRTCPTCDGWQQVEGRVGGLVDCPACTLDDASTRDGDAS